MQVQAEARSGAAQVSVGSLGSDIAIISSPERDTPSPEWEQEERDLGPAYSRVQRGSGANDMKSGDGGGHRELSQQVVSVQMDEDDDTAYLQELKSG